LEAPTLALEQAERRLFATCGVQVTCRRVRLADDGDGPTGGFFDRNGIEPW
jgi:hypothetical protein